MKTLNEIEVTKKSEFKSTDTKMEFVNIFFAGKRYRVLKGLTILKALEFAGYRLVRGVGCRGGFCGACATVYRTDGDYRIKVGLACQTMIENNMYLAQLPFYPAIKAFYTVDEIKPSGDLFLRYYPEIMKCLQCNTCRKVCPQDLDVMRYIAAAQRGDVSRVADLSFDCLQCGLCASRCPAEIVHYHVAQLGRRSYSRFMQKPSTHLSKRIEEINSGKFNNEIESLIKLDRKELEIIYSQRDIEPEEEIAPKKDED